MSSALAQSSSVRGASPCICWNARRRPRLTLSILHQELHLRSSRWDPCQTPLLRRGKLEAVWKWASGAGLPCVHCFNTVQMEGQSSKESQALDFENTGANNRNRILYAAPGPFQKILRAEELLGSFFAICKVPQAFCDIWLARWNLCM